MNLFRLPLNIFVVVVLSKERHPSLVLMICAAAFAVASGPRRPLSACETKAATTHKRRQTQAWPGICYFGADAARVVWMEDKDGKSSDTIYDGKDQGPLYSQESLDADLAAAELVIAAIRSPCDTPRSSRLQSLS